RGHEVEIVTSAFYVGIDVDHLTWRATYDRLLALGVKMSALQEVVGVGPGVARVRLTDGSEREIETDSVVFCSKGTADRGVYKALKGKVGELHAIGDCWAPRQLEQAIYEGSKTGRAI